MTAVAAAVTDGKVVMAADSQACTGGQKTYDLAKIWTTQNLLIGTSGGLREAQVLKHHVQWPKYRPDERDFESFLVTQLVPAIKAGAKDHGVIKNDSGVECMDVQLLVASETEVTELFGNGSALVATAGRCAIGSGYAQALGRLGDSGPWTEDDVVDAIRRAVQTARGVGGAIRVADTQSLTVRTVTS